MYFLHVTAVDSSSNYPFFSFIFLAIYYMSHQRRDCLLKARRVLIHHSVLRLSTNNVYLYFPTNILCTKEIFAHDFDINYKKTLKNEKRKDMWCSLPCSSHEKTRMCSHVMSVKLNSCYTKLLNETTISPCLCSIVFAGSWPTWSLYALLCINMYISLFVSSIMLSLSAQLLYILDIISFCLYRNQDILIPIHN